MANFFQSLTPADFIQLGTFVANLITIWGGSPPKTDEELIADIQRARDFTMGQLPLPEEVNDEP